MEQPREHSPAPTDRPEKRMRLHSPVVIDIEDMESRQAKKKLPKTASSKKRGKKNAQPPEPEPFSKEDVLHHDILALLTKPTYDAAVAAGTSFTSPLGFREEIELEVVAISSNGEGLALTEAPHPAWVVVVPFCVPGERVLARVYRHGRMHSVADCVGIVRPNTEMRDDGLVKCKYFGKCGGCQYQMLPYETQLSLKRDVIVKAFANFSSLPAESVPTIQPTIPSPLQYGYRTKITPHFEAPPKNKRAALNPDEPKPDWLKIGFNQSGTRYAMDIDDCPIATPVLRDTLKPMREDIIKNIHTYKKGVSLILRESLETPEPVSTEEEKLICVTDHKSTIRERVGEMLFEYPAGSFFQNNNSVLVPLTDYVRDAIFPQGTSATDHPTHLVDAYCGSGLFAITLSPFFTTVLGIELSAQSIASATRNVQLLNSARIPEGRCSFVAGDAADIFSPASESTSVSALDFPRDRTALIIDPPRKGTDEKFIRQLLEYGAGTVVYVSCNVHTQARDVGMILSGVVGGGGEGEKERRYVLESVRGVDLFPQTAHVESVAVLRLV